MLFDGRFYRIEKLEFTDDNNDKSERFSSVSKELLNNRLSYFESKDFLQYFLFKLIPYQDVLNAEVYSKWKSLLEQMDITYQVLLYSTSNNKYPIDMNFAFLVELSEPFVELVKENTYLCQSLSPGERGTTLKMCVDALITHFGTDIFEKELSSGNYKSFLDNVIGSRVRIMHIKKKQGKYFEGKECIRYWMKFSILYRRIIFELLGIPYKTYEYKLKRAVKIIDELQLNYCVGG
jgi:hypothetical protein